MYELYRKQEKGVCQPQNFPFPKTLDRIPIWGWGEVSTPRVSIGQNSGNIYIFYFYFFQMALSDLNNVCDTHCQINVLYSLFIPFCTSYMCNLFFLICFYFQCSIQRSSTFKDRFIYIVYIESAKRSCAIVQSRQVFILWKYISLKTVECHVKSNRM